MYLGAVFVGGPLLAPWLYYLVQWLAPHAAFFNDLASHPFHRFVNRSMILVALAGLWPFLRSIGLTLEGAGLRRKGAGRLWVQGFCFGWASLAVATVAVVWLGARAYKSREIGEITAHLVKAGGAALLVSALEEALFRGALFGSLRRRHSFLAALALSSALYALLHFFEKPPQAAGMEVAWWSGFESLARMMRGFADWRALFPAWLNLFLAGAILAYAFEKTGSLWFSMGLHAGWIFWLKSYSFFTRKAGETPLWIWGGGKLIDGLAALLILGATALGVIGFLKRHHERTSAQGG